MEVLTDDTIRFVARFIDDPVDLFHLSICSRQLHVLLPAPLRLCIAGTIQKKRFKEAFFVTLVSENDDDEGGLLNINDRLVFGKRYYLWSRVGYRSCEGNVRAYLARHVSLEYTLQKQQNKTGFSLGLCRCGKSDQTWVVCGGEEGDFVIWSDTIALSVGGDESMARQPDSRSRSLLSISKYFCHSTSEVVGDDEKLKLFPYDSEVVKNFDEHRALPTYIKPEINYRGNMLVFGPENNTEKRKQQIYDFPNILQTIEFQFYIIDGYMYFKCKDLSFTFGIPILSEDFGKYTENTPSGTSSSTPNHSQIAPLRQLIHINSARWWSFRMYMACAADAKEGRSSTTCEVFAVRGKDHPEHVMEVDDKSKIVRITMEDQNIDKTVQNYPRNPASVWFTSLC